jgi:excisionase family DNA binding protein
MTPGTAEPPRPPSSLDALPGRPPPTPAPESLRAEADGTARLLSAEQVAAKLGVTKRWVYGETKAGRIPHIRLGPRFVRFPEQAIDDRLAALERGAPGPGPGGRGFESPRSPSEKPRSGAVSRSSSGLEQAAKLPRSYQTCWRLEDEGEGVRRNAETLGGVPGRSWSGTGSIRDRSSRRAADRPLATAGPRGGRQSLIGPFAWAASRA